MNIKVSQVYTYPLKSATGIALGHSKVTQKGLALDRHWALVGKDYKVITAREFPKLLALQPQLTRNGLSIILNGDVVLDIPCSPDKKDVIGITVFESEATAVEIGESANAWFSKYLDTSCRLVYMDEHCHRDVLPESGGQPGDVVGYADECPVLLLSETSVDDLNGRLDSPVTFRNFRPNLVIQGCTAFAEDAWQTIQIGECAFDVSQRCQRCVFTTIDPDTQVKHNKQEPLRTLSTYRRHSDGGAAFGVHLIPRRLGTIRLGDELNVIR